MQFFNVKNFCNKSSSIFWPPAAALLQIALSSAVPQLEKGQFPQPLLSLPFNSGLIYNFYGDMSHSCNLLFPFNLPQAASFSAVSPSWCFLEGKGQLPPNTALQLSFPANRRRYDMYVSLWKGPDNVQYQASLKRAHLKKNSNGGGGGGV